jgi:hypothetical protein
VGYVDTLLSADVDDGSYSIANHDGSGADGYGFTTLAAAVARMPAGSTIYLRGGTHSAHASDTACFAITKALTIAGYADEAAVITYSLPAPNSTVGHIISVTAGGVTFRKLEIVGAKAIKDINTVDQGSDCINANHSLSGTITIEDCVIRDGADKGFRCVTPNAQIIVQRCQIYDIGTDDSDNGLYISSAGDGSIVRWNAIWNCAAGGIRFGAEDPALSPRYGRIYANAIHDCDFGVILWGTDHECYNNTVTLCTRGFRTWRGNYVFGVIKVYNNILYGNTTADVTGEGGSGEFPRADLADYEFRNNIVGTVLGNATDNTAAWEAVAFVDRVAGDPLFVDAVTAWPDMRVQAGSPAHGAGLLLEDVTLLDAAETSAPTAGDGNSTTLGAFA